MSKKKYQAVFEERFVRNLRRYAGIRKRIKRHTDRLIADPYTNTEVLEGGGKLSLRGCRSARIDRNFRIIFVICEECRRIPEGEYCFCDDRPDETIVFLTVGPHDRAYTMK